MGLSHPADRPLLRTQTWLLSSTLRRAGNILWPCVMEGIAARESGVGIRAAAPIGDGFSAAVSCSVMRC